MATLWVLQTNRQEFLEDCRKYLVYGVSNPNFKDLVQIDNGDLILLRLKLTNANHEFGYIGPYEATNQKIIAFGETTAKEGIWQKINDHNSNGPRWLPQFPWCIFLNPTNEFINELRTLSISFSVNACESIKSPVTENILRNLHQLDFLPESRIGHYRTIRGVWVRSRAEYMIDNWFTEHNIVTYYEKAIYLNSQRIVPDWYIPGLGIYVEYLGLKGEPNYEQVWRFKENLYRKYDINFLTLDENDLSDLDRTIPSKLPQLKNIKASK